MVLQPVRIPIRGQPFSSLYAFISRYSYRRVPSQQGSCQLNGNGNKTTTIQYNTSNAKLLQSDEPYIYARNLLANRIYHCPVLFLEPYVMNNKEFYDRVALGEYEGLKIINGMKRKSLLNEYSDGVVEGLKKYYLENRN